MLLLILFFVNPSKKMNYTSAFTRPQPCLSESARMFLQHGDLNMATLTAFYQFENCSPQTRNDVETILGTIAFYRDKLGTALDHLQSVLARYPFHINANNTTGFAYLEQFKYVNNTLCTSKAGNHFDTVLSLKPNNIVVQLGKAITALLTGDKHPVP